MPLIYKIIPKSFWRDSDPGRLFSRAQRNRAHRVIDFSSATQVVETAARDLAGRRDLLLLAVDVSKLGRALQWEASGDGTDVPRLHGPLPPDAVVSAAALPLSDNGTHDFTGLIL